MGLGRCYEQKSRVHALGHIGISLLAHLLAFRPSALPRGLRLNHPVEIKFVDMRQS